MQHFRQLLVLEEALRRLHTWLGLPYCGAPHYFLCHPLTPPTELSETRRKTAYIPHWRGEASCQVAAAGDVRGAKMWELVYQTC